MVPNLSFSGSEFGNPHRFQIPATRMPQAVARAAAHSCADVSRLQPKLRHTLLSLLMLQMFRKLLCSGSDFGNPHRFQTPATRMPQAVAHAVAHSCVDVSPLLLKLRHTETTLVDAITSSRTLDTRGCATCSSFGYRDRFLFFGTETNSRFWRRNRFHCW